MILKNEVLLFAVETSERADKVKENAERKVTGKS